jgi:NAD(P)-dependent dehydrogenase (short-subunit alcohol dehydrogenase family)
LSKTILITGASAGFGADMAVTLAKAGHRVFATMRNLAEKSAPGTAVELRAAGINVLELDVTSDASVDAAFKAIYAETGNKLDVLVNNAGLFFVGISESFTPDQIRSLFEVNVFGIQRVIRAALPSMRKSRTGLIVNVGSILGRLTIPFVGIYGASKHAVEALTESYRYELSQMSIDVVLLQPGPFATSLYAAPQQPGDPGRVDEYGEVAALPNKIGEVLAGFFQSENVPQPHEVAKTLEQLIATPPGKRPARIVVGAGFGAEEANSALQPLQTQLLHGFGYDDLAVLKVK